ncbi:MAG: hypothetical protein ACLFMX_04515, partial [Halobacteriales archaeon]
MTAQTLEEITFLPKPSAPGLEIVDTVEARRFLLELSDVPTPRSVDTGRFRFAVDRAIQVRT